MRALREKDITTLMRVPRVGRKKAEQIILDLADKMDTVGAAPAAAGNAGQVRLINDNGAGNNEFCLVISTGSAWVTAVGAALS